MKQKRHRVLKFVYADIAKVRGVTIYAVGKAVQEGRFNPEDLDSVACYVKRIPAEKVTKKKTVVKEKKRMEHREGRQELHDIGELLDV